jgi:hypothetical protein
MERLPLPDDPRAGDLARKRLLLQLTVAIFVLSAILILVLPLRLPSPLRYAVAATDLIAAAVIWLLGRQRFRR